MGVLRKAFAFTSYSVLAGVGTVAWVTRKDKVHPLPADDYILNTTFYSRLNSHQNPTMQDVCVRRIAASEIDPKHLQPEGRLVERFCAGVWATPGYAYQRRFLEKKYKALRPDGLWTRKDLHASDYATGTIVTDHFEVINKTNESIVLRCGDSPSVQDPRASDGVFEVVAFPVPETGEIEFQLKSVFFNSAEKQENAPMPKWVEILHRWYTKVLMESAVKSLYKYP